jgi:FkbM family methyltransferase
MSFISYAQNYEDVMLWRALKHIENGFYIDVGAAWPDEHSVTKAFYDIGWSGINIEPNPVHYKSLVSQRPRDINLQMAVGEKVGQFTMNLVGDTGLSTLDDKIATQHQIGGWDVVQKIVDVETLASVCFQHVPLGRDIHFLKVDVEGFEENVLKSNDWTKYKPWVVVVEATLPMTQIESYQEWGLILLDAGYTFAYADGLNRFYVANEHAELLDSFKYPPNFFDGFLLNAQQESEAKAQQAEAKAQQAEAKAQQAEAKAQQAEAKVVEAQVLANSHIQTIQDQDAELAAVRQELHNVHQSNHHHWQLAEQRQQIVNALYSSKSWRITAPMRWPVHQVRLLHQHGFKSRIKGLVKKVLKKLVTQVVARPTLRAFATRLAHRLGVTDRLKPFVVGVLNPKTTTQNSVTYLGLERSQAGVYLDKRAERVFADLKNAKNGVFEK